MSAGPFVRAVYSASYGDGNNRHPIRVQPETLLASAGGVVNGQSDSAATSPISATVSKSKRSLGLHARTVTIQSVVAPPTGYEAGSIVRIPALQEAFYNACSTKGTAVTYLGTTWQSVSVSNEEAK